MYWMELVKPWWFEFITKIKSNCHQKTCAQEQVDWCIVHNFKTLIFKLLILQQQSDEDQDENIKELVELVLKKMVSVRQFGDVQQGL